ncbi:DUF1616 domain-containing protein [Chloroflexota bacterium]
MSCQKGQSSRTKLIDKIKSIIIIGVILAAIGALAYMVVVPKDESNFTEFYILGLSGEAMDYPKELLVAGEGEVIAGIINREHETVSYRVAITIDGLNNKLIGPLELAHGQKWEQVVSFTPDRAGDNQTVEFLLYKNGESRPGLNLYLFVNVNERP